jgi:hypothetical protein
VNISFLPGFVSLVTNKYSSHLRLHSFDMLGSSYNRYDSRLYLIRHVSFSKTANILS